MNRSILVKSPIPFLTRAAVICILLTQFWNCREEDNICNYTSFFQCYYAQSLDSAKLASVLIGQWQWEYAVVCTAEKKDSEAYIGTSIEFLSDGTCLVHRSQSTSTFKWILHRLPANQGFAIRDPARPVFPPHDSLWGQAVLCGDTLLCNGGATDGTDNIFTRK